MTDEVYRAAFEKAKKDLAKTMARKHRADVVIDPDADEFDHKGGFTPQRD